MVSDKARREYERRINKAIDYIAAHLADNPTLDEIAAAASFSKFHFHRLFQAHVGETVLEFTRRLRLERAAAQLHFNADKDITSVALDCGFSSSQNFAKAFKKHFAISPTHYRDWGTYEKDSRARKIGYTLSKDGNIVGNIGNASGGINAHSQEGSTMNRIDEKDMSVTIEVKDLADLNVAYVRTLGAYGFESANKAFEKLTKWAGPRGLMDEATCLGVTWDSPCITPAEKCRYDACIVVPDDADLDGGIDVQTVAGGKYAIHRSKVFNHDFQKGWNELLGEWLPDSGFQPDDRPAYEVYVENETSTPDGHWVVEIHLPVKPL